MKNINTYIILYIPIVLQLYNSVINIFPKKILEINNILPSRIVTARNGNASLFAHSWPKPSVSSMANLSFSTSCS